MSTKKLPKLLDADDVAEILGVTVNRINRMARDGHLPSIDLGKSGRRFDQEAIAAFISAASTDSPARVDDAKAPRTSRAAR